MTDQLSLRFDANAPRITGQRADILDRLRKGPATNGELATVALRYGARLKELRDLGFRIKTSERDHDTGLVVYELEKGQENE